MADSLDTAGRMWHADSVIALLGKLDVERLPADEVRAVGEIQARAVDEWLAAYVDLRDRNPDARELHPRGLRVS